MLLHSFRYIGLAFLIPANISFSLWFFYVLYLVQLLVMVHLGYGTSHQNFLRATRELLRMSEIVEVMLRPVMELYETGDKDKVKELRGLDQEVNRVNSDIKLYLVELNRGSMSSEDAQRCMVDRHRLPSISTSQ